MPIVELASVPKQAFPNGATYQTIVGDDQNTFYYEKVNHHTT